MDAKHYLAGYDRSDYALRAELRLPDRFVGAVQALVAYVPGESVIFVPPDLLESVVAIAELALPASAPNLDWFVDVYSRDD